MVNLILSLDYEIFGNGSGDVMRDVIEPTDRILGICDKHGAKMTIMFEVGEYWAFEQYECQLRNDLGYSPAEQMKSQAVQAIKGGHDVQLHLHPQWIGAKYNNGLWQLNNACWRLADLPKGLGEKGDLESITGSLYSGKQTLENMIKPVKGNYECLCFRAGGFYAQPSEDIIIAMKNVGLAVDSSVVRGYRVEVPFKVDYSQVDTPRDYWWTTDTELIREGKVGENILEIPVSAQFQAYWKNFKWVKLRAALQRRKLEKDSMSHDHGKTCPTSVPKCKTVLGKLFRRHASTFDFCKLSCRDMLNRTKPSSEISGQTLMLIGHSKDFFNACHFDQYLSKVSERSQTCFQTMSEYVEGKLQVR